VPADAESQDPQKENVATLARIGTFAVELQDLFDRMLTLSTGAIALVATFAEKFSSGAVWLGTASLIAFALTIVSCLSVRAAVASWKLAFVREEGLPASPSRKIFLQSAEAMEAAVEKMDAALEKAHELSQQDLEAMEGHELPPPDREELLPPPDRPDREELQSALERYKAWLGPYEAQMELRRVTFSKLSLWLGLSIGLATISFAVALSFLTAFGVSALD